MNFKFPDYIIIIVEDIDKMLGFYTDTMGMDLAHHAGQYAQLKTGRTRLGFYTRKAMSETLGRKLSKPDKGAYTFEIGFKVEDVDAVFKSLTDLGVKAAVEPSDRPWGQRTAYVYDPEENLIELAQDKS